MSGHAHIPNAIAVIGLSGRFPKSANLDQYWNNLKNGNPCITFFSDEELISNGVPAEALSNPAYVKASGLLERIDLFDAEFFNFTPREAEMTDPQHRLFIECAWEAMEMAGYDPGTGSHKIGVFGGCSFNSYLVTNLLSNAELLKSIGPAQLFFSNDKDHLCTKVSYKLNLTGPSVTIQTSCSTSLVCVHFACQSLLNHECDIALAGGASIRVTQNRGYFYESGGIASPDGFCRAFDAKAQGTVTGNGVGVVALKRLEEALLDHDTIHAVIRGSAVNNDGAAKVGYTAPSEKGQSEVIAEALAVAGLKPEEISYVEAHGTGTKLGDPIEVAALKNVFGNMLAEGQACPIGSVKPSIGHLDAAAGIAGLIKLILALKHQVVPQSIHFREGNPEIDFKRSRFYVNTRTRSWDHASYPRKASVSSFGVGGTNAHVVVEEAPCVEPSAPSSRPLLLLMSARTTSALDQSCHELAEYVKAHPDINVADIAYTRATGRRHFGVRRAICCEGREGAISFLGSGAARIGVACGSQRYERGVMFAFWLKSELSSAVGRTLFEYEAFRRYVEPHLSALAGITGSVIFDPHAKTMSAATAFIVEYALARTLIEWGIRPAVMAGDCLGEYVAACLGGALTVDEGLRMVEQATSPRPTAAHTEFLRHLEPKSLQIPYFSATMGVWKNAGDCLDLQYWKQQSERLQRRCSDLSEAINDDGRLVVAFGSRAVGDLAGRCDRCITVLADVESDQVNGLLELTRGVGEMWTAGIDVDWQKYYSGETRLRVPLPTYPFERTSYWIKPVMQATREASLGDEEDEGESILTLSGEGQHAALQSKVGILWRELLGRDVGLDDDFFQVGGDSLTGARLIGHVNRMFQIDLSSSIIFEASTIRQLAGAIEEALIIQIQKQPS